uniref:Major facilitator superfamily MFS_1 n=1 Tax=Solibacter usitatus (strain Ellin6076) TaxID=234267 RepID=Q026B2_SOLUE
MWIGACTSSIGTWMQVLAQSWLVLKLSNSAFLLGLDAFLGGLPIFLFSLVGGVIADRMDRRKVLLGSQYVQMGCAFLLTTLIATHVVHVWMILCLSFVAGLAQAFGGPAYQALTPMLVEKEDMPNAIALQSIQFNVARVIGPALGGIALTQLGEKWCFALNGISFLAPIISLTVIKTRFLPAKTSESILAGMKQGISFIRKQSAMEGLMILAFCMTALGIPMMTFLPVFAKDIFKQGPTVFTLFLSSSGVGSIVGALTVAALGNVRHKGRIALVMLTCLGAGIAGFALSTTLWVSCLMLFLSGAAMISVFALVNSLVQLITTNEMRGRVMSVYNFAFRGGMPLGNLMTGWLVPMFSAPLVLAVNGVVLMMVALYFLAVQRRVAAL